MSTRGNIGRFTENGHWEARYHHFDSYPEGLGTSLWEHYHGHFNHDLGAMLKTLIDDHPAGWSEIVDTDFALDPGFDESHTNDKRPACYCHGDRHEEAHMSTDLDVETTWCEWAYIFDLAAKTMTIFEMESSRWKRRAVIDLDGEEPTWGNLPWPEVAA